MTTPLTDAEKVALAHSFADATIDAVNAAPGAIVSKWQRQMHTARVLLTALLGRAPTDDEVEQARGG